MSVATLEALQEMFRRVFSDPGLTIGHATTASDIPAWDSLSHMHLIAEVESRFGLRFSFEEVRDLRSVGDLVRLVDSKITC